MRCTEICVSAFAVVVLLGTGVGGAPAADYPTRTVSIIVGFPPGGSADLHARAIAKGLGDRLRKPVIVENRAGAGGRLAANLAARANPDGYTLFLANVSSLVIYPTLHSNVQYDPYRDFVPIAITTELPFLLVVPSSTPISNMTDWVSYFRANSDRSTYASWGPASPAHILGEMLARDAKVDLVHVPYKGEAPAVVDLLGGQVSMMFLTSATALPHIKAGKLRALGVTGPRRLPALPDVPTLQESGLGGLNLTGWFAVVVPASTPQEIVTRLHKEIIEVLKSPAFVQFAAAQSGVVVASTPAEVTQRIRTESSSIKKLVEVTKLNLDE